jgi:sterol 3beta-glucosyltransferase
MRVAIHTLGTRGDVQPYMALALGLRARGHDVQLAAPVQFEAMVRERGILFAPLPGEFLDLLDTPEGKAAIAGSQGFGAGLKLLKHVRPMMAGLLDAEWFAASAFKPDIIVHHPKSLAAPHIAEALGCRVILASPLPGFTPTSAFPTPLLPFASLGPLNRISHRLASGGTHLLFGRMLRAWRAQTLRLPARPARRSPEPTIYAYSRHVLPVPADWGADILVSGYWFLDNPGWTMPDDLAAFLGSGAPPVYVGFGSMPGIDPDRMAVAVIEALRRTGKRGLLATGGGAIAPRNVPASIHVVADAPHDRLLPYVASAIHHGGAGTTAAVLRAGKPSAICPFFGDQPFWARRIAVLGVGSKPLDRQSLTAEKLADAIVQMDDPLMCQRAHALGERIRSEDGVTAAVDFIEACFASGD